MKSDRVMGLELEQGGWGGWNAFVGPAWAGGCVSMAVEQLSAGEGDPGPRCVWASPAKSQAATFLAHRS